MKLPLNTPEAKPWPPYKSALFIVAVLILTKLLIVLWNLPKL